VFSIFELPKSFSSKTFSAVLVEFAKSLSLPIETTFQLTIIFLSVTTTKAFFAKIEDLFIETNKRKKRIIQIETHIIHKNTATAIRT
jgi:hypothetical protein